MSLAIIYTGCFWYQCPAYYDRNSYQQRASGINHGSFLKPR
jgi:hypothetical protein